MAWRWGWARAYFRRQGFGWGWRTGREWFFLGRWGERPVVAKQVGPWWRPVGGVRWVRLEGAKGLWWVARRGRQLILLGYGVGPTLWVAQGRWRELVVAPRRPLAIALPKTDRCRVRVVRAPSDPPSRFGPERMGL
ncbi:MAG: hypothetical protein K6U14_10310 [Firmicutes bacterium]|nr:hypothetical protein [Alicyclobacillaceae bacterium]MCL6498002.1 hypothetical protein [Bacillota bacterium]